MSELTENKKLNPSEYFEYVKNKKNIATDESLTAVYENCLDLLNKYNTTGQIAGMKKLFFHLQCIEKERELVKLGINTFVYKDDIEDYIDHIADDVVKIIELENYEREIPDDIVKTIEKVKDKFDRLYIIFTDYANKEGRKVAAEKREKDPILFGAFIDDKSKIIVDRFYFLGDWVDEYCDLTLDKLVSEVKNKKNTDIVRTINTPKDIEELKAQLNSIEAKNGHYIVTGKPKKSIFSKITSIFKSNKK